MVRRHRARDDVMSRTEQGAYRADLGYVTPRATQQRSFMHFRKTMPGPLTAPNKLAGQRRAE
jgi:hypothetical protein